MHPRFVIGPTHLTIRTLHMPDSILVNRLLRHYDPFEFLFEERPIQPGFFQIAPIEFVPAWDRPNHKDYDRRRIAYFVNKLSRDEPVDPIELDNEIFGQSTWGPPIITDGHHRSCAAILVRRRRIECEYSGLVATLKWLKGEGRASSPPFSY